MDFAALSLSILLIACALAVYTMFVIMPVLQRYA